MKDLERNKASGRPYPGVVGVQVEVAEGALDGAAELGGGGLVLGVPAGRVVQAAPQTAPHQTQAEGQLPAALLEHLQRHTGILQSLPRLSHRWGRQVRGRLKLGRERDKGSGSLSCIVLSLTHIQIRSKCAERR